MGARLSVQRCGGHACPPEGCREEKRIQRAASGGVVSMHASDRVHAALEDPGDRLDEDTRIFMEARLHHDFGSVRVHRGATADRAADAVGARAFTSGNHIVVADPHLTMRSPDGAGVLAHELTHVVQQRAGRVSGSPLEGDLRVSDPHDPFERAADAAATALSGVHPAPGPTGGSAADGAEPAGPGLSIQRIGPAAIAGGVALGAGAAYLLWLHHCLDPLDQPMRTETLRWLDAYSRDTGRPVRSRLWDAFGHCWVACAGTKRCGATGTAIAGKSREFYREYLGGGPHDSYEQDTNNQTIGRGFGSQELDCYTACDLAIRNGRLDLSAPESTCYDQGRMYPAPCEATASSAGAPATASSSSGADAGVATPVASPGANAGMPTDAGLPGGVP